MADNGKALADRAATLIRLLNEDMAALRSIRTRWDDDRMADTDITDLFQSAQLPHGETREHVYAAVSGMSTTRDSLLTEVGQAIDAAGRLRYRLIRITEAMQ